MDHLPAVLRHRCALLLISLLGYFGLMPLLSGTLDGRLLLVLANSLVLVGGVLAVARSRWQARAGILLAAICLALQWLMISAPHSAVLAVGAVSMGVFYLFTILSLLAYVLRPGLITADRLYGAVAIYVLLGFLWALFYSALEHWSPGAFVTTVAQLAGHRLIYGDLLYFSFVSLTSAGYGDIVPVSHYARMIAVLEHIGGVMYTAILIARLAGMTTSATGD